MQTATSSSSPSLSSCTYTHSYSLTNHYRVPERERERELRIQTTELLSLLLFGFGGFFYIHTLIYIYVYVSVKIWSGCSFCFSTRTLWKCYPTFLPSSISACFFSTFLLFFPNILYIWWALRCVVVFFSSFALFVCHGILFHAMAFPFIYGYIYVHK